MWLHAAGIRDIDTTRSLRLNPTSMAIQATIDGLGVALGRSVLVENDIAAGRLVRPFEMTSPLDFHYYIVATEAAWDLPKVKAFREFLMAEATADA
jgi:LysR family glycine cleavage system transcriptional activator